jgi:thiol-disulfide isomerase/thioredoxin
MMILRTVFAVILTLSFTAGVVASDEPEVATLKIGAKAPNFDLPGVDGKNWKLSDFDQTKILVVIFTCNHCPTAQYYEERVKKLVADYKDKGVSFVAISPNDPGSVRLDELGYTDLGDSLEEMKIRARDRRFNFPTCWAEANMKPSPEHTARRRRRTRLSSTPSASCNTSGA